MNASIHILPAMTGNEFLMGPVMAWQDSDLGLWLCILLVVAVGCLVRALFWLVASAFTLVIFVAVFFLWANAPEASSPASYESEPSVLAVEEPAIPVKILRAEEVVLPHEAPAKPEAEPPVKHFIPPSAPPPSRVNQVYPVRTVVPPRTVYHYPPPVYTDYHYPRASHAGYNCPPPCLPSPPKCTY